MKYHLKGTAFLNNYWFYSIDTIVAENYFEIELSFIFVNQWAGFYIIGNSVMKDLKNLLL